MTKPDYLKELEDSVPARKSTSDIVFDDLTASIKDLSYKASLLVYIQIAWFLLWIVC